MLKLHSMCAGGDVKKLDFRFFAGKQKIGAPFHGLKAFFTTGQLNLLDKVRQLSSTEFTAFFVSVCPQKNVSQLRPFSVLTAHLICTALLLQLLMYTVSPSRRAV